MGASRRVLDLGLLPGSALLLACSGNLGGPPAPHAGPDAGGAPDASPPDGQAPGDFGARCVDSINQLRATLGLPPYARLAAEEPCVADEAQQRAEAGQPSLGFGRCGEIGQTVCAPAPGDPADILSSCLRTFWAEGPGRDHLDYLLLSSSRHDSIACSYRKAANGAIWVVQDYYAPDPTPNALQSYNYQDHYMRQLNFFGELATLATDQDKADARFKLVPGLSDPSCVSFASVSQPDYYFRSDAGRIILQLPSGVDDLARFKADATFCPKAGNADPTWTSFELFSAPGSFIRHASFHLYTATGSDDLFHADTTFHIVAPP